MKKFGALEEKYYFRSQNEEGKKIINRILHFCGFTCRDIVQQRRGDFLLRREWRAHSHGTTAHLRRTVQGDGQRQRMG